MSEASVLTGIEKRLSHNFKFMASPLKFLNNSILPEGIYSGRDEAGSVNNFN